MDISRLAKAALTAAAVIDTEPPAMIDYCEHLNRMFRQKEADKRANEGFADAIRNNAIATTIERCAQVADEMTEIFGHGRIAAAIRALKQETDR